MNTKLALSAIALSLMAIGGLHTKLLAADTVPVTVDNFIRAESDMYMAAVAQKQGGFGKFREARTLADRGPGPSSARTATRSIRRRSSTSTQGR